jgi:hypothetical protein
MHPRVPKPGAGWLALAVTLAGVGWAAATGQDEAEGQRDTSTRNLRRLAGAMHRFHKVNGFPPAWALFSRDGTPLLSWRVAILPFLGYKELYESFKRDEPWDGDHNRKLLAKMPDVYAPVRNAPKQKYATYYQVFTGKGTAFEGMRGLRIPASFPDGTANTLLIVEAGEVVPWTKPADLPYDLNQALPKVGGLFKDGFHAALADGSVRWVRGTIGEQTLRAAITRDDGMVLGADWD